jgi:hypothetical protein
VVGMVDILTKEVLKRWYRREAKQRSTAKWSVVLHQTNVS